MQTRVLGPVQLLAAVFEKVVEKFQLRGYRVEILWTPSHTGIERNERTDGVAE